MKTFVCDHCGVIFTGKGRRAYCSRSCAGKARATANRRPFSGADNPRFNGGFSTSHGRTIVVCRDGSFVAWARVVMQDVLGRSLRSDEIVHHKNGDRTDDRPENLEVVSRSRHIAIHRDELIEARWGRAAA